MNKKSVLGLLLFSCIVIAGMFLGTMLMIGQHNESSYNQDEEFGNESLHGDSDIAKRSGVEDDKLQGQPLDAIAEDDLLYTDGNMISQEDKDDSSNVDETQSNTTDQLVEDDSSLGVSNPSYNEDLASGNGDRDEQDDIEEVADPNDTDNREGTETTDALGETVLDFPDMQLIRDSSQVDYMKYIPEIVYDGKIEVALDIVNPSLDIKAKSAILFDTETREVLYYKEPVIPIFPASTAKLLSSLVALDWCMEEEEVTVGDELDLVASDSTLANIRKGQTLSIRNLIEGMLVPSGNDAAYVTAAYVGRKSLKNENASLKEAIPEFIRLMNNKAKSLGAINSNFKTPDGYDAIGQYSTAYDMGMIGMAAADNKTIIEVSNKSRARNVFVDGSDVTWSNTNSLINRDSGRYYPYCLGLKTGTSTMAGRCLISVARKDGREVVSVVMNSDSAGRWEDSITLLKYGIDLTSTN